MIHCSRIILDRVYPQPKFLLSFIIIYIPSLSVIGIRVQLHPTARAHDVGRI